jgi:hypothetical protein
MIKGVETTMGVGEITVRTWNGQRPAETYGEDVARDLIRVPADDLTPEIMAAATIAADKLIARIAEAVRAAIVEDRSYSAALLEKEGHAAAADSLRARGN